MKTYTTGDIAQMCDVNQRTVIRWIDRGELQGFKLPGRGNNRVTEESLVSFLQQHDFPLPEGLILFSAKPVLIVDDDSAITKAIQRVLRGAGYKTVIALDGFEAGSELVRNKPLLMTLDLKMPGMDGFEVIKQIRNKADISHTKILVISSVEEILLNKALDIGADDFISKPFTNSELLEKVEQLILDAKRESGIGEGI
ncbi:response regulator [Neptuniibacter sp.]|uniref:response regulator n=1 Tax=Neptuniibacter sp. TaxID=1962643 RepID=UPI003B5A7D2A